MTHVLAGEDGGPAKMAKAEELGIKILNENEFIEMLENSNKTKHIPSKDKKDNHESKNHKTKLKNGSTSKDEAKCSEIKKEKIDKHVKENAKIKSEVSDKNHDKKSPIETKAVVELENVKSESVSSSTSSINLAKSE